MKVATNQLFKALRVEQYMLNNDDTDVDPENIGTF